MKGKTTSGSAKVPPPKTNWRERISQQDHEELKATFELFDEEGNGTIDPAEINKILEQLGLNRRNQTVFAMITDLQAKSRPINFEEFLEVVCGRVGDTKSLEGIQKIFNLYDRDNSGTIDFEKFKQVARELGETMNDEEIVELMHNTHILNNTESNEYFTFEEFYTVVTKKRY